MRIESSTPLKNLLFTLLLFYKRLFSDRYLRYNILILCTNILGGAFSYLLHPSLAHIMTIQEYGQVAALVALSFVLITPTQIFSNVAAKYASTLSINGDYAQLNGFIRRLTGILLIVGVGVAAAFMLVSNYLAQFFHLDSTQDIILLGTMFVVSFISPLNLGVLLGLQRFGWFATITLLLPILRLVLVVGFVLLGFGVNSAILGIAISTLLTYLVSFLPLWKLLRGPRTHSGPLKSVWSYAILTATVAGGSVTLSSIDTVLAGHFLNIHETGLYAALATIGRTIWFINGSINTVMFPRVVRLHEQKKPHWHVVAQAMLGVVILSATIEMMFFLAPSLITKILFGQAFIAISGLLPLYGFAMLLLSVSEVLLAFFLAIGNRTIIPIVLLACLLQIALIIWHHSSPTQLLEAVLITNAVFMLALIVKWGMTCYSDILQKIASLSGYKALRPRRNKSE